MPSPATIGGALMGYPSTVDTGQAIPPALYVGDLTTPALASLTANTAYLTAVYVPGSCTLTAIRWRCGTAGNGNIDVGIYDASGTNNAPVNLLAHLGSTLSVTGIQTYTLATPLTLSSGNYWLAFWAASATDTFQREQGVTNLMPSKSGGSSTGLLALTSSFATPALGNNNVNVCMIALLQGGWT